jgi:hypothetical protein
VASIGRSPHEVRTRVMCHLPVNNSREEKAFFRILSYLRKLKDQGIGVNGWTTSTVRPAVFHGWWWSEDRQEWILDDLVLCFIDYLMPLADSALSERVEDLKQTIRKCYRLHRSPQEEVWVVAYPVTRQD